MIEFKEKHHNELRKFSSGPIQNEVLNIKSELPSSEYNFERKFQVKLSPYNQKFEQPKEEWIEIKKKHKM